MWLVKDQIIIISQIIVRFWSCVSKTLFWLSQPVSCWFPWETLQVNYGLFAERFQNGCVCVEAPVSRSHSAHTPPGSVSSRIQPPASWMFSADKPRPWIHPLTYGSQESSRHPTAHGYHDNWYKHYSQCMQLYRSMKLLHVYFQKQFSRWISFKLLPYLNEKINYILHKKN